MNLDLDVVSIRGRGRKTKPIEAEFARELTLIDLQANDFEQGVKAPALTKITDRHHALAKLLAVGNSPAECSAILGYNSSRISILQADPAFQELLSLYREKVDETFVSTLDHMAGLQNDALLELRDRIETQPEKFSNKDLLAVVTDMKDRLPEGPGSAKAPVKIELVPGPDPAEAQARVQRELSEDSE